MGVVGAQRCQRAGTKKRAWNTARRRWRQHLAPVCWVSRLGARRELRQTTATAAAAAAAGLERASGRADACGGSEKRAKIPPHLFPVVACWNWRVFVWYFGFFLHTSAVLTIRFRLIASDRLVAWLIADTPRPPNKGEAWRGMPLDNVADKGVLGTHTCTHVLYA